MDALGVLNRYTLASMRPTDLADVSMISVAPAEISGRNSEFLGVAIMDGRRRIDMHFGRPTTFRVEPGEHTITVQLKRRFRVTGYRGRAIVSLPVVVQPGEHLDLVFGFTREREPLRLAKTFWFILLFEMSLGLAYGAGPVAFPVLRDVVTRATLALEIRQPWLTYAQFFVSSRGKTAIFAMLAWAIVAIIYQNKHVSGRSGAAASPYFLLQKADFGRPSPILKAQYVDPFE